MYKRIGLVLIFILISIEAFNMLYAKEKHIQYESLVNIGQTKQSIKILIHTEQYKSKELYDKLTHYLDKYHGNIYCTKIMDQKSIKYMYFTNMNVFSKIQLKEGRFFNLSEKESNQFISTKNTNDQNQIGQIATFTNTNKSPDFELRTLKAGLDEGIFKRSFYLELKDKGMIDLFIRDLMSEEIYIDQQESFTNSNHPEYIFMALAFVCFFILIILIFYHLIKFLQKNCN